MRDLAALRGTYRIIEETKRAAALLFSCLAECGAAGAAIYLDRPVSNSGRLRQLLAEVGENYPLQLAFHVQNDVDRALYEQAYVISSDSVILDRCRSWFNAGRLCLERTGARALRIWEKEGGGCTLNEKEMKNRLRRAAVQGVPMTNYGIFLAQAGGILARSLELFPQVHDLLEAES